MIFNINDLTSTKTITVNKIEITILAVSLFESATIRILYYDTDGLLVAGVFPEIITLSQTEYSQWGNDDTYILSQILAKLSEQGVNITIQTPPP